MAWLHVTNHLSAKDICAKNLKFPLRKFSFPFCPIFLYSIIRIVTPFPRIEIHVNTGNMYDIQVTNKTFIGNELCSGFKTQGLEKRKPILKKLCHFISAINTGVCPPGS